MGETEWGAALELPQYSDMEEDPAVRSSDVVPRLTRRGGLWERWDYGVGLSFLGALLADLKHQFPAILPHVETAVDFSGYFVPIWPNANVLVGAMGPALLAGTRFGPVGFYGAGRATLVAVGGELDFARVVPSAGVGLELCLKDLKVLVETDYLLVRPEWTDFLDRRYDATAGLSLSLVFRADEPIAGSGP